MKKPGPIFEKVLSANWILSSAEKVKSSGEAISSPGFKALDWYPAQVPTTVLAALVQNGIYQEPYFGTNLQNIPADQFTKAWWFRTEFELSSEQAKETVILLFEGINYRANIWLNGQQIAVANEHFGAFRQFKYDISNEVSAGSNALAIEVVPPEAGDFSIGFVDWNTYPPDRNMGLFRTVKLQWNKGVSIEHSFVATKLDLGSLQKADLTIHAELINHLDKAVSGILQGTTGDVQFKYPISLMAKERVEIALGPKEIPELRINKPKLWWPNNLGKPHLYNLELSFVIDQKKSDEKRISFGIREIEDYWNGPHRGFKINGRKVLIKGAGWTDDLLLQDDDESLEAQIAYVKHMNLNCIRLEGIWGKNHKLYDLCDQNGILIMVGWSCHWEHEEYLGKPVHPQYGGVVSPEDIAFIAQCWKDQLIWLRHHPSIFVWTVASDFIPHPDLERKYVEIFKKYDPSRPYLNSTGGVGSEQSIITNDEIVSEISGSSGMKMLGPYAYTPPIYWYTDKTLGGAYGFNTETCPGANVPPLESIAKMIPGDHLWPIDEVWEFHCGKNAFRSLDRIQKAINHRYGEGKDVNDFAKKAQLLNYEGMRPMFEAFRANKVRATGIIQWMLNSAWPRMYWQLYDHYLMPNGAFYATRKACEPLHLLYRYDTHTIVAINDTFEDIQQHRARIKFFDINSKIIYDQHIDINMAGESSSVVLKLPAFAKSSPIRFLDLRLSDQRGKEISNNFYWLSAKKDVLDYEATFEDWAFYTPCKAFADFTQLVQLPKVQLKQQHHFVKEGDQIQAIVKVENPGDKLAFFTELNISGKNSGQTILPVFWEDNYITLLPGEKREIQAVFAAKNLGDDQAILNISPWNG